MLSSATLIVNNESGKAKDGIADSDTALGVTAARKLAAAQKRAARKAARRPRMFSESTYEYPTKGILKHRPLPKRSVSECIDDISQIMDELNIELTEQDENRTEESNSPGSDNDRPKKSVRFNEEVYETLFIASCLYDRQNFAKFHFSTRHHPPPNQNKKHANSKKKGSQDGKKGSKNKNNKKKASSESGDYTDTSSDDQSSGQEDNANSNESVQCSGDSFNDLQSSLGNKMSKHNRKENREKKSTNLRLIQNYDNDNNNDDIFNENSKLDDIKSSDHSIKNGLSKQIKEEDNDSVVSNKKPPRRSTIDSGYDSTEEENMPWTTVRKGRKRWNSASA